MLFAFLALASFADWVPMRSISADPASLDLIASTPINCLLLERDQWRENFTRQAAARGITTLGVIRPGLDPKPALAAGVNGLVFEGVRAPAGLKVPAVEITTRAAMRFDSQAPILATYQGVWPGIREEGEGAHAAASGGPWIDTNTGFLRFARASTSAAIWIANQPPAGKPIAISRYLQALGDASMAGARWVVSLDSDFARRLLARDLEALKDWQRIAVHLRFYEEHKEWRALQPRGTLALVEDVASGALLSGGILDMIAVKHTPVRPVPQRRLEPQSLLAAKMAVNVDPESLSPQQKEALKAFTRAGGTLLTAPPGWKFPSLRPDQITLEKDDLDKLDQIWKELNSLTGRRNLGARLFNVSSFLSNLLETPDGKQVVLHLVNYSDYPVENVTVHVLGKFRRARLVRPGLAPVDLQPYEVEDGTGLDIEQVGAVATVVLD